MLLIFCLSRCGLRFARSKQKKEGVLPQRRKKKDKINTSPKSKKPNKSRRPADDMSGLADRYSSAQENGVAYHSSGGEGRPGEDSYYGESPRAFVLSIMI